MRRDAVKQQVQRMMSSPDLCASLVMNGHRQAQAEEKAMAVRQLLHAEGAYRVILRGGNSIFLFVVEGQVGYQGSLSKDAVLSTLYFSCCYLSGKIVGICVPRSRASL